MVGVETTKTLAFSPLLLLSPPRSNPPSPVLLSLRPKPLPSSSSSSPSSLTVHSRLSPRHHHSFPLKPSSPPTELLCKAAEYVFPDPIPEFAEAEVDKFKTHLVERLSKKKDLFGDSVEQVVGVCTEILSNFLNTEYGGPGTLLVLPFIDMADALNEKGLPGGPQAARAAVVWAEKHIDDDWDEWTGGAE